jgi:hypothetical protein
VDDTDDTEPDPMADLRKQNARQPGLMLAGASSADGGKG